MSLEEREAPKTEQPERRAPGQQQQQTGLYATVKGAAAGTFWSYWPQVLVFIGMLAAAGLWYWWSESGDWVVRVNGAPVSKAEWQRETARTEESMARIYGFNVQEPGKEKIREQISKEVLKQLVDRMLLRQAAIRNGISASPEDVAGRIMMDSMNTGGRDKLEQALQSQGYTLDQYRELVAEMITISKLNEYVTRGVTVTEGEARAEYDAGKELLTTPEQVKVGHILVPTKARAMAMIAGLDRGASFQQLADANSTDPAVKDDHGVIGYITRDDPMLPEAFKEAAFNTPPGAYTREPVQTELGWHVLFVFDKQPPRQMSYQDAHDQIKQRILTRKKNGVFVAFLDRLRENSLIESRVQLRDAPQK